MNVIQTDCEVGEYLVICIFLCLTLGCFIVYSQMGRNIAHTVVSFCAATVSGDVIQSLSIFGLHTYTKPRLVFSLFFLLVIQAYHLTVGGYDLPRDDKMVMTRWSLWLLTWGSESLHIQPT